MDSLDRIDRAASPSDAATSSGTATGSNWSAAVDSTPPPALPPAPAPSTQHVVQHGDTLDALSARYGAPASDILHANPSIHDPNQIKTGQVLDIPLKAGGALPGQHTVQPGETLSGIATHYHTSVYRLATANGVSNPNHVQAGQQLWVPGIGGHVEPAKAAATSAAKPSAPTSASKPAAPSTASQVHTIVAQAQAGSDPAKSLHTLSDGYTHASDATQKALLADPGANTIINGAVVSANQPMTQKSNDSVFPEAKTAQAIVRLDGMTRGVDKTLAGIVADRAAPAYQKFAADPANGGMPIIGPTGMTSLMSLAGRINGMPDGDQAISRFASTNAWNADFVRNSITAGGDPAYAIGLAQEMKAHGEDPSVVVQTINDGMQGREAGIAAGGSVRPTLDVANRMQAAGLDASGVMWVATQGVQGFKDKVGGDVGALAKHDAELGWLVQNDGAGLSPAQLNKAVAAYTAQQGPAWQKQGDAIRAQIADDGTKLLGQMTALNQAAPQISGAQATTDSTLQTVVKDPAANLAISTAIQTNPQLSQPQNTTALTNLFGAAKLGDYGRKFANELAARYVRTNVLDKLQGLDLSDPASVAAAKKAVGSLSDETFAKLIGVAPGDTDKAVAALQKAVDQTAADPSHATEAMGDLDSKLNNDASLLKAFNKTTLPGQLLRGAGVAFAGVSLLNSGSKALANPQDPQNDIKALVDAASFTQRNSELLLGLGAVSKESAIGKFGGEWKLAGGTAGDLLAGVSAVLDGVSAVRSEFGIGEPQDSGAAVFSATSAVGGGLAIASAFGAAAWLGPVGLGVAFLGTAGAIVYQDVKASKQYEGASKGFLAAAGYNANAASALSGRDGVLSGASGAPQMPFLAKYAEMKHISPDQLQQWVNGLSPGQEKNLSASLLMVAADCHSNPTQFTNGPLQKSFVGASSGFPVQVPVTNTVTAFEQQLDYDHVPHP